MPKQREDCLFCSIAREGAYLHKAKGFVVLGFPCNQFGAQDPGPNDEIASFCQRNYGVSFPMMAKVDEGLSALIHDLDARGLLQDTLVMGVTEFGRTPGAQVSVVTRSGNNEYHGTAFEYFRNDKLNANDWFANSRGEGRAPFRLQDFGAALGGTLIGSNALPARVFSRVRPRPGNDQERQAPPGPAAATPGARSAGETG